MIFILFLRFLFSSLIFLVFPFSLLSFLFKLFPPPRSIQKILWKEKRKNLFRMDCFPSAWITAHVVWQGSTIDLFFVSGHCVSFLRDPFACNILWRRSICYSFTTVRCCFAQSGGNCGDSSQLLTGDGAGYQLPPDGEPHAPWDPGAGRPAPSLWRGQHAQAHQVGKGKRSSLKLVYAEPNLFALAPAPNFI